MKKYRGKYIDHVVYNSEAEIDAALKDEAVASFKSAVWLFWKDPSIETSIHQDEAAEKLNREFGWNWSDIETLEIETLKELDRKQKTLIA